MINMNMPTNLASKIRRQNLPFLNIDIQNLWIF